MEKVQIFHRYEDAPKGAQFIDKFNDIITELFFILHPTVRKGELKSQKPLEDFLAENSARCVWVYYPWANKVLRCPEENLYLKLRTARNRNAITTEEQARYRDLTVGIAGLSVGSKILSAIIQSGGPKNIKIADFDTLELSNLNRLDATFLDIGESKAEIAARRSWELDPFVQIAVWSSGLNAENIENFLLETPRLEVFIDEIDDLKLKIRARSFCQKEAIPVIMATDNGDTVILDIERFDIEKSRPLFHGALEGENLNEIQIDFPTWLRLSTKIVDPKYLTTRMQESLLEVGKTIAGIPQLGTTAAIAGSAVSFALRRIANNQELPSGRYLISLEEKLIPHYDDAKMRNERMKSTKKFVKEFNL